MPEGPFWCSIAIDLVDLESLKSFLASHEDFFPEAG